MVREVSQPDPRFQATPVLDRRTKSRKAGSSSSTSLSASRIPIASSSKRTITSVLSTTRPRSILGEREDENIIPLIGTSQSRSKLPIKQKSKTTIITRIASPASSVASSAMSSTSTPRRHKTSGRRSTALDTMRWNLNEDETQLLHMREPELTGLSSPATLEVDDWAGRKFVGTSRGNIGPSRMMTPADSQETVPSHSQEYTAPSTMRPLTRLPTPPSSQSNDNDEPLPVRANKGRPRPAPTPPRHFSNDPQTSATPVVDPSPNPRRKKSPRIDLTCQGSPLRVRSQSSTPRPSLHTGVDHAQAKSKSRASLAVHPTTPIYARLSSQEIVEKVVPATAPVRRHLQSSIVKVAPKTTAKPRSKPRKSRSATPGTTAKSKMRKSMTPAELFNMTGKKVGVLETALVISDPEDDPLLLKALDDDEYWEKISRAQKRKVGRKSEMPVRSKGMGAKERVRARSHSLSATRRAATPILEPQTQPVASTLQVTKEWEPVVYPSLAHMHDIYPPVESSQVDGHQYEEEMQYDPPAAWGSDDDTDNELQEAETTFAGGVDDTFVHVLARKMENASQGRRTRSPSRRPVDVVQSASDGFSSHRVSSPSAHSVVQPDLQDGHVEPQVSDNDAQDCGDLTQEAISAEWDISLTIDQKDGNDPALESSFTTAQHNAVGGVAHLPPRSPNSTLSPSLSSATGPNSHSYLPSSPIAPSNGQADYENDHEEGVYDSNPQDGDITQEAISGEWDTSLSTSDDLETQSQADTTLQNEPSADEADSTEMNGENHLNAAADVPAEILNGASDNGDITQEAIAEEWNDSMSDHEDGEEAVQLGLSPKKDHGTEVGLAETPELCNDGDITQDGITDHWNASVSEVNGENDVRARDIGLDIHHAAAAEDGSAAAPNVVDNGDVTQEALTEDWDTSLTSIAGPVDLSQVEIVAQKGQQESCNEHEELLETTVESVTVQNILSPALVDVHPTFSATLAENIVAFDVEDLNSPFPASHSSSPAREDDTVVSTLSNRYIPTPPRRFSTQPLLKRAITPPMLSQITPSSPLVEDPMSTDVLLEADVTQEAESGEWDTSIVPPAIMFEDHFSPQDNVFPAMEDDIDFRRENSPIPTHPVLDDLILPEEDQVISLDFVAGEKLPVEEPCIEDNTIYDQVQDGYQLPVSFIGDEEVGTPAPPFTTEQSSAQGASSASRLSSPAPNDVPEPPKDTSTLTANHHESLLDQELDINTPMVLRSTHISTPKTPFKLLHIEAEVISEESSAPSDLVPEIADVFSASQDVVEQIEKAGDDEDQEQQEGDLTIEAAAQEWQASDEEDDSSILPGHALIEALVCSSMEKQTSHEQDVDEHDQQTNYVIPSGAMGAEVLPSGVVQFSDHSIETLLIDLATEGKVMDTELEDDINEDEQTHRDVLLGSPETSMQVEGDDSVDDIAKHGEHTTEGENHDHEKAVVTLHGPAIAKLMVDHTILPNEDWSERADPQQPTDDIQNKEAKSHGVANDTTHSGSETMSGQPRKSSRITLRLVERGVVKIEPSHERHDSSCERDFNESEDGAPNNTCADGPEEDEGQRSSVYGGGDQLGRSSNDSTLTPGRVALASNLESVRSFDATNGTNSAMSEEASDTDVLGSIRPQASGMPSIPTALTSTSVSTPLVHRFAAAQSTSGVSSVEAMLRRRQSASAQANPSAGAPSRLSHQSTGSSSVTDVSKSVTTPANRDTSRANETTFLKSRRSLGDELAIATAADDDADEAFKKSVVEVSSLDPRAAARAAAILKLNHKYIEQGVIPTTPASTVVSFPTSNSPAKTPYRHAHRKSNAWESEHFSTIESSRKLNREDLLYEAELEIVQSRRSRSRSRSRARSMSKRFEGEDGWGSDETELALPGGWKSTPGKRKRQTLPAASSGRSKVQPLEKETVQEKGRDNGRPWGVSEWKRLEKVYRLEKELWIKERDIKPLPVITSGIFGWAKKALSGAKQEVKAKDWDMERVVDRFVKDAHCEAFGGEWDRKMIALRVKALEKRINRHPKETEIEENKESKKPRIGSSDRPMTLATPAKASAEGDSTIVSIVPPTTIRRMLGSFWSAKTWNADQTLDSIGDQSARLDEENEDDVVIQPVKPVENKLLSRLKEVQGDALSSRTSTPDVSSTTSTSLLLDKGKGREEVETPMKQVPSKLATSAISHPSSPNRTMPLQSSQVTSSSSSSSLSTSRPSSVPIPTSRSIPADLSIMSASSVATPYKPLYPPLNPPYTQRSTAIRALFDDSSKTSSSSRPVTNINRSGSGRNSPSVLDLVKSFESEGVLARSLEMKDKDGNELQRVRSRGH